MREMIDAFLIQDGYKTYSHEASIAYAADNLNLTDDQASQLDKYRRLRNDSKYRGEDIEKREAANAIQLANTITPKLEEQRQS